MKTTGGETLLLTFIGNCVIIDYATPAVEGNEQ